LLCRYAVLHSLDRFGRNLQAALSLSPRIRTALKLGRASGPLTSRPKPPYRSRMATKAINSQAGGPEHMSLDIEPEDIRRRAQRHYARRVQRGPLLTVRTALADAGRQGCTPLVRPIGMVGLKWMGSSLTLGSARTCWRKAATPSGSLACRVWPSGCTQKR